MDFNIKVQLLSTFLAKKPVTESTVVTNS